MSIIKVLRSFVPAAVENCLKFISNIKKILRGKFSVCFNVIIDAPTNTPTDYQRGIFEEILAFNMAYPMSYGYIPQTLFGNGSPMGVLVDTPLPLMPGAIIRCRCVGLLEMDGRSSKVLAVPVNDLADLCGDDITYHDLPKQMLNKMLAFFDHANVVKGGEWIKAIRWKGIEAAQDEILYGRSAACLSGVV